MNHGIKGGVEEDEASIDRPMRRTTETPADTMARLSLNEGDTGPSVEAQASEINSSRTADSLEALPPNARGDTQGSPYGNAQRPETEPSVETSQALQSANNIPHNRRVGHAGHFGPKEKQAEISKETKQRLKEEEMLKEQQIIKEEYVEEDEDEESSEISASDEDGSWITWFCSLRGNEFFCEVDEDYIQDDFNLTGLNGLVPHYDYALDMVLDVEMPMEDSLTEEQQEIVESAAEMLYGLIHARYIVTNRGMHAMYEKYRTASFGRCPHVFCQGQPVLPVGLSDLPRNYTVNVFCPRCHGLFFPKSTRQANIDGAYFGTTFPHLYLMTHPDMVPLKPNQNYVPRVYGFKIHNSSLYYKYHNEGPQQSQIEGNHRSSRKSKNRHSRK